MPRIQHNLCKRATGMLNAGMTINAVAMNIGCSTSAIRHLMQHFRATGRTEDQSRSGRQRVMTRGKDSYIRYTTYTIASNLPQPLLLTPMAHITTVYLPKMWAVACAEVD